MTFTEIGTGFCGYLVRNSISFDISDVVLKNLEVGVLTEGEDRIYIYHYLRVHKVIVCDLLLIPMSCFFGVGN